MTTNGENKPLANTTRTKEEKLRILFLSLMLANSLVACENTALVESVLQESGLPTIQLESMVGSSGSSIESSMPNVSIVPDTGKVLIAYFSLFGNADCTEGGGCYCLRQHCNGRNQAI